MSLIYVGDDPAHFYRPLFLPWRCRGVRTRPKPQGPEIQLQANVDERSFDRARRALDSLNKKPGYRPPAWLWILVAVGFACLVRAVVFGWKGTHP